MLSWRWIYSASWQVWFLTSGCWFCCIASIRCQKGGKNKLGRSNLWLEKYYVLLTGFVLKTFENQFTLISLLQVADANWTRKSRDRHNSQRWATRSFNEDLTVSNLQTTPRWRNSGNTVGSGWASERANWRTNRQWVWSLKLESKSIPVV